MKKLIFKTSYFAVPFLISFALCQLFYVKDKGDVLRMGYFSSDDGYDSKTLFAKDFARPQHPNHHRINELNLQEQQAYDVLVLGDSFSSLGNYTFQDYLAEYSGKSVLTLDRYLYESPLDQAHKLANGDFFDKIKVKYLLLQSAERKTTQRAHEVAKDQSIKLNEIESLVNADKRNGQIYLESLKKPKPIQFFSKDVLFYPVYSAAYLFTDRPIFSLSFRAKLNKNCFSADSNNLLFLHNDVRTVRKYSSQAMIEATNKAMNDLQAKLSQKGIQLILLVAPDKYDAYYDYIVDKSHLPKPVFFEKFDKLPKNYHYIQSKNILSELIKTQKDVYYFDDSHWSPKAAKAIAHEINLELKK
jgi:SGNH hydrolase-like domain, acetyltransferase AlgX